jgi:lysophospholipase L1-like esterase
MNRSGYLALVFFALGAPAAAEDVYLIGDYTMADFPKSAVPQMGWGSMLPCALPPDVKVHNDAVPGNSGFVTVTRGTSSKSYLASGKFAAVEEALRPGDYLLIQFGHEDERSFDISVYTNPETSFRENLKRFVDAARVKGAIPVLVSPLTRRSFDKGVLIDSHGPYARAVRATAQETETPLIDLNADSMAWLKSVGEAQSQKYFLAIAPKSTSLDYPNGRRDDADLTELGAREVARLVAVRFAGLGLAISPKINPDGVAACKIPE